MVVDPMEVVDAGDPDAWRRAEESLASGAVVALPTDTVYGVAAAISHPDAVVRLFALKDRDTVKPVAVLVADSAQAAEIAEMSEAARVVAERFWPGALTLVLPRADGFDIDLGGAGHTVGVRSPAHDDVIGLCRRLGPLATTSANRSGHPTPDDATGVANELAGTEVAIVVDGGPAPGGTASTVVRVEGSELHVLRDGPITLGELHAALGDLT
jgi:L-threonylcarbamoyladenylate synthase